jgi:hypothetical protein
MRPVFAPEAVTDGYRRFVIMNDQFPSALNVFQAAFRFSGRPATLCLVHCFIERERGGRFAARGERIRL